MKLIADAKERHAEEKTRARARRKLEQKERRR